MIPKDLAYQGPGCARPCAIMKPGRDEERGRQAPGSRTHYRFRSAPGQASTHLSAAMAELIAARDWLTAGRLPPRAHELSPAELAWSRLRRSLASPAGRNLTQLTALAKTRPRPVQYRPGLPGGFPRQHQPGPHTAL